MFCGGEIMKRILTTLIALVFSGGIASAAVVQPTTPLPDYEFNAGAPCDASAILHIDCIGMVSDSGLNPAPNDSEAALSQNGFFGYSNWMLVDKDEANNDGGVLSMTGFGTTSGTYSFTGVSGYVYALVVKAAPGFSAYLLDGTSATNATWDTLGVKTNTGGTPNVSHLSLYKTAGTTVVPLPAAGWLILACLGALGVVGRRKS